MLKYRGSLWELHLGDLEEVCLQFPPESVDLIITDPPYSWEKYKSCFEKLAKVAMHVLKNNGLLIFIPGDVYLDKKMEEMSKAGLSYVWAYKIYLFKGPHTRLRYPAKFFIQSKLLLVYGKDLNSVRSRYSTMPNNYSDTFISYIQEKDKHEWQQSVGMMREIVRHFALEGDIILDPFVGTGTTGEVATEMGCYFIGVDIDENMLEKARIRLKQKEEVIKLWGTMKL